MVTLIGIQTCAHSCAINPCRQVYHSTKFTSTELKPLQFKMLIYSNHLLQSNFTKIKLQKIQRTMTFARGDNWLNDQGLVLGLRQDLNQKCIPRSLPQMCSPEVS